MTSKQRFEAAAAHWDAQGRAAAALSEGYSLIALRCWSWSAGGKAEGMSPLLAEFRRASEAAQKSDWLDAYFDDHESCRVCGERYRFENVKLCTHCHRCCCESCTGLSGRAENGNPACACGGELVG